MNPTYVILFLLLTYILFYNSQEGYMGFPKSKTTLSSIRPGSTLANPPPAGGNTRINSYPSSSGRQGRRSGKRSERGRKGYHYLEATDGGSGGYWYTYPWYNPYLWYYDYPWFYY